MGLAGSLVDILPQRTLKRYQGRSPGVQQAWRDTGGGVSIGPTDWRVGLGVCSYLLVCLGKGRRHRWDKA